MKKRAKLCAALTCALLATALAAPGTRVLADEESSVESVVEETTETEETAAEEEGETEETDSSAEESIAEPASTDSGEETPAVSEADAEEAGESETSESGADALYERFMVCKTQSEFDSLMDSASDADFEAMTEAQISRVMVYYMEELVPVEPAVEIADDSDEPVESEYYSETVNYSSVAPLKDPVQG